MIARFRGLTQLLAGRENRNPLAQATARFNGIIASAMDAIISLDAEQRIILFNPAAQEMFGVTAPDALGQHINRFIPERFRAAHARHIEHFGQTGASNRHMGALGKIYGLRANGEEFPIEASISQVDVDGEKIFTARLQETVAELEAFSYSLSHDLRAPLRAIRSFIEIALAQCANSMAPQAAHLPVKFVAPDVKPQVRLYTQPGGNRVRLWVQDNGIGIPPESQQRIYDAFQRLHSPEQYEGSGIGLAIVRRAVEKMGGTVGVEAEPGNGSRFWLELPKANEPV